MKKILTLLTLTMIAANLSGCCCRRFCPWLDRGAYCGPTAPVFSPLAAAAPMMAPSYQYAAPLAATAPAQCCPTASPCATWDPCQGQVNYGYPPANYAAAGNPAMCCPTAAIEPGCGYVEAGCGQPYMGGSYGPALMSGGCDTCGTGYSGPVYGGPSYGMPGMPMEAGPAPAVTPSPE
jgi:hypothetical protein